MLIGFVPIIEWLVVPSPLFEESGVQSVVRTHRTGVVVVDVNIKSSIATKPRGINFASSLLFAIVLLDFKRGGEEGSFQVLFQDENKTNE